MANDEKQERYFQFIDQVVGARELVEIDDRFARYVFEYLEGNSRFEAQGFVALLTELIILATQKDYVAEYTAKYPEIFPKKEKSETFFRDFGAIAADKCFALISQGEIWIEKKVFLDNLSLEIYEKKLSDIEQNSFFWNGDDPAKAKKIGTCFAFVLKELKIEAKLDVFHLLLCALNWLAQKNTEYQLRIDCLNEKREVLAHQARQDAKTNKRGIEAETKDIEIENRLAKGDLSALEKVKVNSGQKTTSKKEATQLHQRHRTIIGLALRYGILELTPEDIQPKEAKESIYSFVGGDKKNFSIFLKTALKTESTVNSMRSRIKDLHIVKNYLEGDLPEDALSLLNESGCDLIDILETVDNKISELKVEIRNSSK